MRRAWAASLVLLLASCAGPAPGDYVGGHASAGAGIGLGRNAAGETCTQHGVNDGADIFCGDWEEPSGAVRAGGGGGADALRQAALSSPWRSALNARFVCADPATTTILGSEPALVMTCTRKVGGWPQVALAGSVGGRIYLADGILPALPVLERSIGVLSGRVQPQDAPASSAGQSAALLAARLAAQSFGAGSISQYQSLMAAGNRANLAESFVAAERAYRAALALQQKALGANDPNTAVAQMLIALQLSDQGRTAEADVAFARADRLAAGAANPLTRPQLQHYKALNALNQARPADALPLLRSAEAGYAALVPPDLLAAGPRRATVQPVVSRRGGGGVNGLSGADLLDPDQQAALIGVIENPALRGDRAARAEPSGGVAGGRRVRRAPGGSARAAAAGPLGPAVPHRRPGGGPGRGRQRL